VPDSTARRHRACAFVRPWNARPGPGDPVERADMRRSLPRPPCYRKAIWPHWPAARPAAVSRVSFVNRIEVVTGPPFQRTVRRASLRCSWDKPVENIRGQDGGDARPHPRRANDFRVTHCKVRIVIATGSASTARAAGQPGLGIDFRARGPVTRCAAWEFRRNAENSVHLRVDNLIHTPIGCIIKSKKAFQRWKHEGPTIA
jgi:hypothetical protein